jgi:hypothetical protein
MANKWIKHASGRRHKGALHRQMGIPQGQKIPRSKLRQIVKTPIGQKAAGRTVTRILKQRSLFALNAQKRR